jgi:FkbM family methyltransferase
MGLQHLIRKGCRRAGYDIVRFEPTAHPLARRKRLLEVYEIDTVLDIGANAGMFAREIRGDLSYAGRILSFEPLSEAFAALKQWAAGDPNWSIYQYALGDRNEECKINISANSYSSSLLNAMPALLGSAPASKFIGNESIYVRTLDSVFNELCNGAKNVYMKIDTQGFESRVLRGAAESIPSIATIQLEMSLIPLYEGELLFQDMCALLTRAGYTLVGLEPGFSDEVSGQLLQVDGIFHRF